MNKRERQEQELGESSLVMELPKIAIEGAGAFKVLAAGMDLKFDPATFVITYLIGVCGMSGIDGPKALAALYETGALARVIDQITDSDQ
jgi:hypothetical protein